MLKSRKQTGLEYAVQKSCKRFKLRHIDNESIRNAGEEEPTSKNDSLFSSFPGISVRSIEKCDWIVHNFSYLLLFYVAQRRTLKNLA